ncbi:MAG: tetratricopeptide repeat protein [Rudaea sp.]
MKSWLNLFGKDRASSRSGAALPTHFALDDAEELLRQGNEREDHGDFDAALKLYQRAVALSPELARAHLNLGNAHAGLGSMPAAMVDYRRAIALQPDLLPAHLNLGAMLLRQPDAAAAEASYRQAVNLAPESAQAWTGLGCALDMCESDEAEAAFRKALLLDPQHSGAASRLAHWLREHGRARDALQTLQRALEHDSESTLLLRALAEINAGIGEYAVARDAYARILASAPQDWNAWSNALWTLNFLPQAETAGILAEHQAFGKALARALPEAGTGFIRRERQRLKVGYVSGDFRRHSVACFVEPLLRHHDRNRVEVHCFYNYPTGDEVTRRLFELADHWHDIAGMDDEEVAQRMRDNGIDILVDLAGHTAHNRIGVFARKPAPVQFTWLGYLCTTGLSAMDFRLCDAYTDPPGVAEAWQVETPVRLTRSQWCYRPQIVLPPLSGLPWTTNGYWTFGSFNQESKLNEPTLLAWSGVLQAIPDSRLRIAGVTCDWVEERIRAAFSGRGISAQRVDILGRIPIDAYFAAYRDVDIALDTFPYNGATTTCDALIMGVPVATVAGRRAIARSGVSLLTTAGLADWIAPDADGLVAMLQTHTADPRKMDALRHELPQRMRACPLMDGAAFANAVETIYAAAWKRRWLE